MISYRTKRSHARSQINRIFSRVVFLERKLGVSVFSSLFTWGWISSVENDFEWQSQRKKHFKNGFSLGQRLFTSPKIYLVRRSPVLFLAFHYWSGIILFSSDSSFFTFFRSSIGNLFLLFSFFSFLPFRSLIGNSSFVIRSLLRRLCCPLLWGKRWGFFSWAKVQSSLRLCLNMVFSSCQLDFDIWGKTNLCVKVLVSGWISILFPRGMRNNDDLETTCKISHGYS